MKLEEANMLIQEGHLNHEDYFRGLWGYRKNNISK
jgi:hypothetical protein